MNFDDILKQYDFTYPKQLIAHKPATPRDAARLLVYNRQSKSVTFDTFRNLPNYLPNNAVIVLNETKVIPARLKVVKETGGKANILYIRHTKTRVIALADHPLTPKTKIYMLLGRHAPKKSALLFEVEKKEGQFYYLKPSFPTARIRKILDTYGQTPLPPYIKSTLQEKNLRTAYQTVFAKKGWSVAAPTASLHFTERLLNKLKRKGIKIECITLNVGLGTFASLRPEQVKAKLLHQEWYTIDPATAKRLNTYKKLGSPIVAVGTTVVRALESASLQHPLKNLQGETGLFIQPGYKFQYIDALVTNFHVPRSSLLMLVAAFAGREQILELYRQAIARELRLFSVNLTDLEQELRN